MSNSMKTTGVPRGMSRSCIALLLFTCCALVKRNLSAQEQGRNIRNFVLVHGRMVLAERAFTTLSPM
jgi:hypothetical protein